MSIFDLIIAFSLVIVAARLNSVLTLYFSIMYITCIMILDPPFKKNYKQPNKE